jgi:hypothetical protein
MERMMDTYDEMLSPDDLAMKGVGMIAAALNRTMLDVLERFFAAEFEEIEQ